MLFFGINKRECKMWKITLFCGIMSRVVGVILR